jgi:hypothetical protein
MLAFLYLQGSLINAGLVVARVLHTGLTQYACDLLLGSPGDQAQTLGAFPVSTSIRPPVFHAMPSLACNHEPFPPPFKEY